MDLGQQSLTKRRMDQRTYRERRAARDRVTPMAVISQIFMNSISQPLKISPNYDFIFGPRKKGCERGAKMCEIFAYRP